jgi:bifunctional NMN adenylyltransferase/nudix hydrolase
MSKKYQLAVFIGRMQPFHNGHLHVIREGFKIAENVLVLFGDSGGPRTVKNPFTPPQRGDMLVGACKGLRLPNTPYWDTVLDHPNDQIWISRVNDAVSAHMSSAGLTGKVAIIGHHKDTTSDYINWFPKYDTVEIPYQSLGMDLLTNIDATKIREFYFQDQLIYACGSVPQSTLKTLAALRQDPSVVSLFGEYSYIQKYKKSWEHVPYPVTFVTVDAVVVQSGHVLLVRRAATPGKGTLALPGGFVDQGERLFDASLRELKEETGIALQDDVLKRCYVDKEIYDDPNRSLRGRTITTAFLYKLSDSADLPKLKGGHDPDGGTDRAMWVPINELTPENMFEDHYFIVQDMLQKL